MTATRRLDVLIPGRRDITRARVELVCADDGVAVLSVMEFADLTTRTERLDFWPGYEDQPCGGWDLDSPHWQRVMAKAASTLIEAWAPSPLGGLGVH